MRHQRARDLAHRTVHRARALGAPRDVDERQRGIEPEAADGVGARARTQVGAQRIAGDHDAIGRKVPLARRERDGDAAGQPRGDAVGEARHRRLLVHHHRHARRRRAQHDRQRDEAAGGQHHAWRQPAHQAERLHDAGGHVDGQVGDVAPCPVAAQLAGGDDVVRDGLLRRAARFHAVAAADPGVGDGPLAQQRRDGQPGARVTACAPARDDDHLSRWRSRARSTSFCTRSG